MVTAAGGATGSLFRMIDIAHGRWDSALRHWADRARQTRIPLMIDFGVEMNGDWFPWNGRWAGGLAGAHAFRDAYRRVVRLFRQERVGNASFAFHIDADGEPAAAWNRVRNYYPGDRYIDWVGMSVYGAVDTSEEWQSFARKLGKGYNQLVAISKRPIAVFESGVVESPAKGDKAGWIRDAFRLLRSGRFLRLKAISWWQEKWQQADGHLDSTMINSDPVALRAYQRGIASTLFDTRPDFRCAR